MFLKEKSDIIEQAMPCKKEYIHLLQDSISSYTWLSHDFIAT